MFRCTSLALVASIPLLAIASFSMADGSGKWTSGQEVYQKVCIYCHEAGVSPVLLGRKFPPEALKYFVRHGSRAMPAFKPSFIDDKALDELSKYIFESTAPAIKSSATNPSEVNSLANSLFDASQSTAIQSAKVSASDAHATLSREE